MTMTIIVAATITVANTLSFAFPVTIAFPVPLHYSFAVRYCSELYCYYCNHYHTEFMTIIVAIKITTTTSMKC